MPRWLDDLVGYNQILADDGTPARRRHILKFVGATVVDDGEATVVTTSGATTLAEYFLGAPEPSLPNHRLPVESSTIGWNLATPNTFVAFVKPNSVQTSVQIQQDGVDLGLADTLNLIGIRASVTDNVADIDALSRLEVVNPITGTQNAYVIPATVKHRDHIAWIAGGSNITLNGINSTGVPEGFEFTLNFSDGGSGGEILTLNDESGSATLDIYRLSLPDNLPLVLSTGCSITFRRAATRWAVESIGWPLASTSIVYNGRQLRRAALTGAITAAIDSNATAFGAAASLSVLANATNGSAVPAYLQAAAARQHLRVNAAGTALEWSVLQLADFPVIASDTFLANVGISPAAPTAVTLTSVAGLGLVWDGSLNEFQVGGSTSIIVGANDVQRAALTGFVDAAQNVNATTSAEPIVSYSASANMTAERVLTTGTNNTVDISVANQIRINWDGMQFRRNSGTFLTARRRVNMIEGTSISITVNSDATDDENEVTIAYNGVIPGAVSGAVTHAAGGGNSTFSGIRDNGSLETARSFINFVSTTLDTIFSITQDAGNDELEVRVSTLGSFYAENSGATIQTKFISFDNASMITSDVIDNTLGSGYINVSFNLAQQSPARVLGVARGGALSVPAALTPDQLGSIARFNATEDINVAGLVTDVAIAATSTNVRFSNGGNTGIIRSIAAPGDEGQIVFPEMTTAGGDEYIYVHDDTSQTAANRVFCPGNRPFRGISGGPPHMLYYGGRSNHWTVIGPVGGLSGAIVEIDEHFDNGLVQTVESTTPILLPFRNNEFSWGLCGNPLGTGSGGANAISNVLSHRGIWRIDTGTATNDGTCIFLGRDVVTGTLATNEGLYDSDNVQRFACWVRFPSGQTTSFKATIGLAQDAANTDGGTEFIGFIADTASGVSAVNWILRCRAASTNTDVASATAFGADTWHKLDFYRYDEYVIFYINRVFQGIISTNVPNGNVTVTFRIQTLTTAERALDVDRCIVEVLEASMD
jgi:hypothetical protein